MNAVIVIVAIAGGTYVLKASLLAFADAEALPSRLRRAMPNVGPAVMAAIIVPAVVVPAGTLDLFALRPLAALAAAAVAWRWHSIPLALVVGLGVATLGVFA